MDIATAQKFLQDNHRACIAVRQKDGWPQMTLVTPGIDAEGRVILTSRGTTYKVKHLRRDPRVSMLVFGEQYSGSKFVQIHGTAEVIDLPQAMDRLIYWYKQVRGEHKNWEDYKKQMADEKRVLDPRQHRKSRPAKRESDLATKSLARHSRNQDLEYLPQRRQVRKVRRITVKTVLRNYYFPRQTWRLCALAG